MPKKNPFKVGREYAVVAITVDANCWNAWDTSFAARCTRMTAFEAPALDALAGGPRCGNYWVVDPLRRRDTRWYEYNEAFIEPNVVTVLRYLGELTPGGHLWERVDETEADHS